MTSGGKRKGAGRPAKTDARTKTLRVRLTEGELADIDRRAKRAALTRADYVRVVLTQLAGELDD